MKCKPVIILGGTGNGTVIAHAMHDANRRGNNDCRMVGYLNDRLETGSDLEGDPVLGGLSDIPRFIEEGYFFLNVIYRIDGQDYRIDLFEKLNIPETHLATFIHPLAYVSPDVELKPGCVVMPQAAISSGVTFGKCCIVMVCASIGHNTFIEDHCHFAAQSCVGSCVTIKRGAHVGLNATIRENVVLAEYSTLAMGGVLLENTEPFEVWGGVPARFLRDADREL